MQILSTDSKLIYDFFIKPDATSSAGMTKLLSFLNGYELNYTLAGRLGLTRLLPEDPHSADPVEATGDVSDLLQQGNREVAEPPVLEIDREHSDLAGELKTRHSKPATELPGSQT